MRPRGIFLRGARRGGRMGYVDDMRARIGSDMLMTASTGVIVVSGGRMLLQKRADNGLWGMHGGSLEIGESFEDCARRELYEETGLRPVRMELAELLSGQERIYSYPNGDMVYAVGAVYICREFEGELRPQQSEVSELHWFDPDALPELTPPDSGAIRRAAMRLIEERGDNTYEG